MDGMNNEELMEVYIACSKENLDLMDRLLLQIEQNPENIQTFEEISKAIANIQELALAMGFTKIELLIQEMGQLIKVIKDNRLKVNSKLVDLLFESFDVLRRIVNDSFSSQDTKVDSEPVLLKLKSAASQLSKKFQAASSKTAKPSSETSQKSGVGKEPCAEALSLLESMALSDYEKTGLISSIIPGQSIYFIRVNLAPDCLLKGARVFMVLRAIEELYSSVIKANPSLEDLENENFDLSFDLLILSKGKKEELKESIGYISEVEDVSVYLIPFECLTNTSESEIQPDFSAKQTAAVVSESKRSISEKSEGKQPQAHIKPEVASRPPEPKQSTVSSSVKTASVNRPSVSAASQERREASEMRRRVENPSQIKPRVAAEMPLQPPMMEEDDYDSEEQVSRPETLLEKQTILLESLVNRSYESNELHSAEELKQDAGFIQIITFKMEGEMYGMDIRQVETIINRTPITRVPKAPEHIDGVISLRGEIISVINTRRRLRLPLDIDNTKDMQILILSFEEEKIKTGILVERVSEVIKLPESMIEPPIAVVENVDLDYLKGVGKINNDILIILNPERLVFGIKKERDRNKN